MLQKIFSNRSSYKAPLLFIVIVVLAFNALAIGKFSVFFLYLSYGFFSELSGKDCQQTLQMITAASLFVSFVLPVVAYQYLNSATNRTVICIVFLIFFSIQLILHKQALIYLGVGSATCNDFSFNLSKSPWSILADITLLALGIFLTRSKANVKSVH